MRSACLLATAVFALFSYWQWNDLDQYGTGLWYGWAVAYGATAALSLASARKLLPPWLYAAGATLAFLTCVQRTSEIDWKAAIFNNPINPAGNEAGGLLVVGLWLGFLGWRSLIAHRAPDPRES